MNKNLWCLTKRCDHIYRWLVLYQSTVLWLRDRSRVQDTTSAAYYTEKQELIATEYSIAELSAYNMSIHAYYNPVIFMLFFMLFLWDICLQYYKWD